VSDRSELLAAELFGLWKAGSISLPQVAALYAQGSRDMHNTGYYQRDAFRRTETQIEWNDGSLFPSAESSPALGPVLPHWSALRDRLQLIMARTATNLTDAGTALCMIANEYAQTDGDAATRLNQLIEERRGSPSLDQPPGEIPQPRSPGDPYEVTTVTIDTPWGSPFEVNGGPTR
jgi:hypothetical protein